MSTDRELLDKASAEIDRALAAQPKIHGDALTAATTALCGYRERLLQARRADPAAASRDRIATLNAVIAMVMATHYPIGGIPWDELTKARGWLAGLIAAPEGAAIS